MENISNKSKITALVVLIIVLSVLIKVFVFEAILVTRGDSVLGVESYDYLLLNRLLYVGSDPERGDLVLALDSTSHRRVVMKIVGLPGERIDIEDGRAVVRLERGGEPVAINEEEKEILNILTDIESSVVLDIHDYLIVGQGERGIDGSGVKMLTIGENDIRGKVFGVINFKQFSYKGF